MEAQTHVQEHVDTILKHEQEFIARRTASERLGDTIAGFVIRMNQEMAAKQGLSGIARDREIRELGQQTSIDEVAQTIQESLT